MYNRNEFLLAWSDHYRAAVKYENEILMLLEDDKEASIVCRYAAYKKKEDFLFAAIMDDMQTAEQEKSIWDNLKLDERSGKEFELIEISFSYEGELHQLQLSKEERLLMLRKFIPLAKQFITTGYGAIAPPYKDLMVVAYPYGLKVKDDLTEYSSQRGQEQRAMFARRFNFGEVKDSGWMFAKYNSEGKIQPL